ncbi:CsbD family protein [Nocardiopsis sp. HNM0947]|uniref:CsbD family protein n=1 Tax=Nocardiopsis coralli TaxID=2772213 RepID=A0ABR9PA06_9ACTN|nr:CsbD family protein [Nocardiopsis coralli]MBE3000674.1 CsbD family protein [Nocardiopsis coralli]
MSKEEKGQSKVEQAKGKLKETAGKVTGNESLEGEGRAEQAKGKLREGKEDVKDTVRGVSENLRPDDEDRG